VLVWRWTLGRWVALVVGGSFVLPVLGSCLWHLIVVRSSRPSSPQDEVSYPCGRHPLYPRAGAVCGHAPLDLGPASNKKVQLLPGSEVLLAREDEHADAVVAQRHSFTSLSLDPFVAREYDEVVAADADER